MTAFDPKLTSGHDPNRTSPRAFDEVAPGGFKLIAGKMRKEAHGSSAARWKRRVFLLVQQDADPVSNPEDWTARSADIPQFIEASAVGPPHKPLAVDADPPWTPPLRSARLSTLEGRCPVWLKLPAN